MRRIDSFNDFYFISFWILWTFFYYYLTTAFWNNHFILSIHMVCLARAEPYGQITWLHISALPPAGWHSRAPPSLAAKWEERKWGITVRTAHSGSSAMWGFGSKGKSRQVPEGRLAESFELSPEEAPGSVWAQEKEEWDCRDARKYHKPMIPGDTAARVQGRARSPARSPWGAREEVLLQGGKLELYFVKKTGGPV